MGWGREGYEKVDHSAMAHVMPLTEFATKEEDT